MAGGRGGRGDSFSEVSVCFYWVAGFMLFLLGCFDGLVFSGDFFDLSWVNKVFIF